MEAINLLKEFTKEAIKSNDIDAIVLSGSKTSLINDEMSDYDIFDFWHYSTCAGSRYLLYGILFSDRAVVNGCNERSGSSKGSIRYSTWNYFCCFNSERYIPTSLLESKEKAEKVEEPCECVIK